MPNRCNENTFAFVTNEDAKTIRDVIEEIVIKMFDFLFLFYDFICCKSCCRNTF